MWSRASWISKFIPLNTLSRSHLLIQECQIHRYVAPTIRIFNSIKESNPPKVMPRNQYLEWNLNAELYAFGKRLSEEFDPELLKRAFTHRSYIIQEEMRQQAVGIENPELLIKDNKELIEQGGAFMSDYVHAYLSVALPKFPEDGIVAVRDYLTSQQMLAHISSNLGTKDIILSNEYPPSEETLAKTFKAIIGALAHSSGPERAGIFVRDFVVTMLNGQDVNHIWKIDDPMSLLKELLSKSGKEPEPRLIGQLGKNTLLSCFRVALYVDKEMFCFGYGESVEIATEMAAREGLKIFFGTRDNMAPINFKIDSVLKKLSADEKKLLANS